MRKRLAVWFVAVMFALVPFVGARAAEIPETIVHDEAELVACFNGTGVAACKLQNDIGLSGQLNVAGKIVTLDLNGKKIYLKDGAPANGGGMLCASEGAKLTVKDSGEGGIISPGEGNTYAGIQVMGKGDLETPSTQITELVVDGGTIEGHYYAITGQGTQHDTKITINGGKLHGLDADDGGGIYHPQRGDLIVNGGEIKGVDSGIEMRAGNLTVNGGTIESTEDAFAIISNAGGSTTDGAGIAVVQHQTKLPLSVTVNGGTVKGLVALYEKNIEKNPQADIDKVKLEVNGGTFISTANQITEPPCADSEDTENVVIEKPMIVSEDEKGFVYGGVFNRKLEADLLAEGVEQNKDEKGNYVAMLPDEDDDNPETLDAVAIFAVTAVLSVLGIALAVGKKARA